MSKQRSNWAAVLLVCGVASACDTGRSILGGGGLDVVDVPPINGDGSTSMDAVADALDASSSPDGMDGAGGEGGGGDGSTASDARDGEVSIGPDVQCPAGRSACGSMCVDLQTDRANCGMCGRSCSAVQSCLNGACISSGAVQLTLTWDRQGDMDLHLVTPIGVHVFYGNKFECTEDERTLPGFNPTCDRDAGAPSDAAVDGALADTMLVSDAPMDAALDATTDSATLLDVVAADRIAQSERPLRCTGRPGYIGVPGAGFGAVLDVDDTVCTGPENIFWTTPPAPGRYVICVAPFNIRGATNFTLTIRRPGLVEPMVVRGTRNASTGGSQCEEGSPNHVTTLTLP